MFIWRVVYIAEWIVKLFSDKMTVGTIVLFAQVDDIVWLGIIRCFGEGICLVNMARLQCSGIILRYIVGWLVLLQPKDIQIICCFPSPSSASEEAGVKEKLNNVYERGILLSVPIESCLFKNCAKIFN